MDRRNLLKALGSLPFAVTAFPAIAADRKPDGTATAGNVKLEIFRGKDDDHYALRMSQGGKTYGFGLEVPDARKRGASLRRKKEFLLSADGKPVKLMISSFDDGRLSGIGVGSDGKETPVQAQFLGWLIGAVLAIVIVVIAVVGARKKIKEQSGSELLTCAFDLAERWKDIFGDGGSSGPFIEETPPPGI